MNCDFNFNHAHVVTLQKAIAFIEQAGFPKDWRVIVACNEKDWERLPNQSISPRTIQGWLLPL